jgi:hypothetical protein
MLTFLIMMGVLSGGGIVCVSIGGRMAWADGGIAPVVIYIMSMCELRSWAWGLEDVNDGRFMSKTECCRNDG